MRISARLIFIPAIMISPGASLAQTTIWGAGQGLFRDPAQTDKPRPLGWENKAQVGINFSLSSSEEVVGQTNGTSQTYGTSVKGSFTRLSLSDEWRSEIALREATTKTPNLPRYVKTSDELKLGTIYLYFLPNAPQFGPYVRAELTTPLFKGEDVRPEPKTYRVNHLRRPDDVFTGTSVRLTDGLRPLTTKEATGLFWRPVHESRLRVETRLGLAAMQVDANGQYAVKGENDQGEVVVDELDDFSQGGVEAALNMKGKFDEKSAFELGAESLTPFINDRAREDRSPLRLTNVDAIAKLTSKITSWASMSYEYRLKMQPQLVDRAQQTHMFTFNITYPVLPD